MHPIHVYLNKFHHSLGVYITRKCNIECGHCGIDSSPTREEHINLSKVLPEIEKAIKFGDIKSIHLSGGEPFLGEM